MKNDIKYTPWKVFIWFVGIATVIVMAIGSFALTAQSSASGAITEAQLNTQKIESQKEVNTERYKGIQNTLIRIEDKLNTL